MDALKLIAQDSLKEEVPVIEIGDTVKVSVRVREGEKSRIQIFEGTVIARKGSGISETFTVRRVSYGVGVERVFPIHSPNVAGIQVVRHGRVRCRCFCSFPFLHTCCTMPPLSSRNY